MARDSTDVREKLYDEALLRSRTREHALKVYEKRWGVLTQADASTLDIEAWMRAWERAAELEKRAQKHFIDRRGAVYHALKDAAALVHECRTNGLPMGEAIQILEQCAPAFLRALETIKQKRALAQTEKDLERPARVTWIRNQLEPYYPNDDALAAAPREELAVLSIVGGWWPDSMFGTAVRNHGKSIENVLAAEGDLMARARARIAGREKESSESTFTRKLLAMLLEERNLPPMDTSVRSETAQLVPRGHDDRPNERTDHRGPRRM